MQVDELESVIVAAGDDGAQRTKEIEGFEVVVKEREDAMMRGHSPNCQM